MAANIVKAGTDRMIVAAPAAVTSGDLVLKGNTFGIAIANAASAANVALEIGCTATLRKLNGASTSYAQGARLYWDATNSNVTISATSNTLIGVAAEAGINNDTTATVRLNPAF